MHIPFYILIQHLHKGAKVRENISYNEFKGKRIVAFKLRSFNSEMTTHPKLHQQSNYSKLVVVSMDQLRHIWIHFGINVKV